ncbi:MAG: hypothetical protein QOH08_592 [Chloroflexota bacterium]|jgi:hypothetical protein|nr:hypothetical protein [Chloroflexota bacterium]
MDIGVVISTVIVMALVLATVAGFIAARVLMHLAQFTSPAAVTRAADVAEVTPVLGAPRAP